MTSKRSLKSLQFVVNGVSFLVVATYYQNNQWWCDVKNLSTGNWKPMLWDSVYALNH